MNGTDGTILHVDMDAFFAAVEVLDRPELRGLPVIVGSPPDRRGVVSTCSYEARAFGVHSAMPSRTAGRLCPHGVFLPVRGDRYAEVSGQVMKLFREITPVVQQVSVDEAFLDVRSVLHRVGTPVRAARLIKQRLRDEIGLTGSVGVAVNKFLAKVASDCRKPDGLTVVPTDPAGIRAFLDPLPVRRIWGVGKKTAEVLNGRGIHTVEQLRLTPTDTLQRYLGPSAGLHVRRLAEGLDDRPVNPTPAEEKSISNEDTFERDCEDAAAVRRRLIELAEKVGRRLRESGKTASVGHVKIRFADFRTITRQRSLGGATAADRDLLRSALDLFDREKVTEPVRLIGFGVSGLQRPEDVREDPQLLLFADPTAEQDRRLRALDDVVDELRRKYGSGILKRGL